MFSKIKINIATIIFTAMFTSYATSEPLKIAVTFSSNLPVSNEEWVCMREALFFEARNQSSQGIIAIGHVILNRVKSSDFPNSICGVVHQGGLDGQPPRRNRCQFSYYCDGKPDTPSKNPIEQSAWLDAGIYARLVLFGRENDPTNGSTYYHALYVSPFWAKSYTAMATIGDHIFYRHYD